MSISNLSFMESNTSVATRHIPVLLAEVISFLQPTFPTTIADCTFGGGGHSRALLNANPANRVVAVDRDTNAVARAEELRAEFGDRLSVSHSEFSGISKLLAGEKIGALLADLGMSTDQLWEGRGFSFADSELDMRMDKSQPLTAQELLNTLTAGELVAVLRRGGVTREARRYAAAIANARPITSAKQLAEVIQASAPRQRQRGESHKTSHPATVVFQALRIAVNDEFGQIEALMGQLPTLVNRAGGRVAIISFHSLEDQLVAKTMRRWAQGSEWSANSPGNARPRERPIGKLLTPKAVMPSDIETVRNPSSRSARMRVFEFSDQFSV